MSRRTKGQLLLEPQKSKRRLRDPRKYRWFRLYFLVGGKNKAYRCKHGAATFATGAPEDELVNVTCTHQVPDSFRLKPWDEEES